ncbi:hypothetical protein [Streptomyces tendae]|uniref:hypothetical protein n=1 Tax=Streptomyces tendae TaxID=1932 RepID=UPI0036502E8C
MDLGEFKAIGRQKPAVRPIPEPDAATRFLANTLANIAAWRAADGARKSEAEGAADEVAVRFTPRELEHVVRVLADDASPSSMALLHALTSDDDERLGDVSTGEWMPLDPSDVLSEQHSWLRS